MSLPPIIMSSNIVQSCQGNCLLLEANVNTTFSLRDSASLCVMPRSFPHLSRLLSRGRKPPNWVSPTIMGFVLGCCWPKPSYTLAKWKCNTESWTECLTDNCHIVYLFIYITELCLERQMWALPAFFFFFTQGGLNETLQRVVGNACLDRAQFCGWRAVNNGV